MPAVGADEAAGAEGELAWRSYWAACSGDGVLEHKPLWHYVQRGGTADLDGPAYLLRGRSIGGVGSVAASEQVGQVAHKAG